MSTKYFYNFYESGKQLQTGNFSRGDLKRRTGLRDAFVLFTEMNGPVSPDLTLLFVYKPDPHGLHTLKYAGTYFQFRGDIETKGWQILTYRHIGVRLCIIIDTAQSSLAVSHYRFIDALGQDF